MFLLDFDVIKCLWDWIRLLGGHHNIPHHHWCLLLLLLLTPCFCSYIFSLLDILNLLGISWCCYLYYFVLV